MDFSKPRLQNRNREQPIPGFGFGTGGTVAALATEVLQEAMTQNFP